MKLNRVWKYLFVVALVFILTTLMGIKAEASFGHKPANYNDLTEGHRIFLAEVAAQRGYVAYPDMENLSQELLTAFKNMKYAANKSGVRLSIVSGYRNYNNQLSLFFSQGNVHKPINKFYSDNLTESERNQVEQQYLSRSETVAPPGYSEHSTGLAVDLNTISSSFVNTHAYRWLQHHAKEFGFTLSYPKKSTGGAVFEPWHWRFDGNTQYKNSTPISSLAKLPESPRIPLEEHWEERNLDN